MWKRGDIIVEEKERYVDVTKEWLKNANPNSHEVLDSYFYVSNNMIYIVDGSKKVVLDYSLKELEVANWIENTFGGEIYMNPRVNIPKRVKTADYWWNGEYWDLKELKTAVSKKRAVDNLIKNCRGQSHNFIIDITESDMLSQDIIVQIKKIFDKSNINRSWINKIIIKKNDEVFSIFVRK